MDELAARAFLDNLWDLTARALLAARYHDAAGFADEAEAWLRTKAANVLGEDEHRVWKQRFATSRSRELADSFDRSSDQAPSDPYLQTSFVADARVSGLLVHEVACTSEYTRLTWSRAETSPEQAMADANTVLDDDLGTTYVPLDSGGGSGPGGETAPEQRYVGFSRFAPAVPREATQLNFRTGQDSALLSMRRRPDRADGG